MGNHADRESGRRKAPVVPWPPRVWAGRSPRCQRLGPSDLTEWSLPTPVGPVVYFLLLDGVVVYVGQTRCLLARLGDHVKCKAFSSVRYMPVPEAQLYRVESYWIGKLRPQLNKALNGRRRSRAPSRCPRPRTEHKSRFVREAEREAEAVAARLGIKGPLGLGAE